LTSLLRSHARKLGPNLWGVGLDAFVHCRCFQDGLAAAAPVEVVYDPDDGICPVREGDLQRAQLVEFDRWLKDGCTHRRMEAAWVHISNWGGLQLFREAIARVGADRLPALSSELPELNGGHMAPGVARLVLAELEIFEGSDASWDALVLVDADSGEVVNERVDSYDGVFPWSGRDQVNAGIDADGPFFVRDRNDNHVRFQATEATQEAADTVPGTKRRPAVLRAADGHAMTLSTGLSIARSAAPDSTELEYPEHLRVERRPVDTTEFATIVAALRRIMTVSATTGNPVHWT
jgi:hypothetical protein